MITSAQSTWLPVIMVEVVLHKDSPYLTNLVVTTQAVNVVLYLALAGLGPILGTRSSSEYCWAMSWVLIGRVLSTVGSCPGY